MKNPYKEFIFQLFQNILELRHNSNRIKIVLEKDVKLFQQEGSDIYSGSILVINDWTGSRSNFPTGNMKIMNKENYNKEVERIISKEFCLAFAQSFEYLETFLKNCAFNYLSTSDSSFNKKRENIKGGDELFKMVKKICGKDFNKFSDKNNKKIHFKLFWTIISEARHSIVHSSGKIKLSKLKSSSNHFRLFDGLFNYDKIDEVYLQLKLDYQKLDKLLNKVAEFAFQILKLISEKEGLEYKFV